MEDIREVFYEKFNAILSKKREDYNFYLSTEKYNKCVENVLKFKGKESKQRAVCKLLKRYDVVKIMSHNQLLFH